MGSSDGYNSGGFTQGDDGAVFGDPSSDPGSIQDYATWDWKQIMAAINGMSAGVDNSANSEHAKSVSDPQSLQDAADTFYQVQQVLTGVAQALTDQAKALAGDDGPWKGDAADSFLTMVETFTKQINATAGALSGGTSGVDSVPQQLADNAVNLLNAQNKINEIDTYYANEAIKAGVQPMSNGLIPISQKPQLVSWMNEDMRAVLKNLAGEYQVTIDSVRAPSPITSPGGNGPNQPDTNGPDQPAFQDRMPSTLSPDLSGLRTGEEPTLTPLDKSALDSGPLSPLSLSGAGLSPSGLGTGSGLSPSGIGPLSNLATTGPGLSPTGLDRALNPSAYDGGLGTGGTGTLPGEGLPGGLTPSRFGSGLGTDGKGTLPGEGLSAEDPAAWKSLGAGEKFPGETGVGGVGSLGKGGVGSAGLGGEGLSKLGVGGGLGSAAKFPGSTSLASGIPGLGALGEGASQYPGLGDAGTGGPVGADSGEGMPYLPGMGGGASGAQSGQGERSDASGLLDSNGEPWAGSTDLGEDIGHHLGTAQGGEGLGLPTEEAAVPGGTDAGGLDAGGLDAGEGMPYLPGMGGGASGASQTGQGERSDASGLLDPSHEPWAQGEPLGEELGSAAGTAAGGEGLWLPAQEAVTAEGEHALAGASAAEEEAGAEQALAGEGAAEGMPFMPGTGGAAGQTQSGQGERSDASGLLDPSADPWTASELAEEPDAQGAAAGGGALLLPAAASAAPQEHRREEAAETAVAAALTATAAAWAVPDAGEATEETRGSAAAHPHQPGQGQEAAGAEEVAEDDGFAEVELTAPDSTAVVTSELESVAEWDTAAAAFVPLLWSVPAPEEEGEVHTPGWAEAEEGTWGPVPELAPKPAEPEEEEPRFAVWRPSQTVSGSGEPPLTGYRNGAALSCADGDFEEEPETEAEETEAEQETATRTSADLLVQEGDTWGVAADDDFGAII